MDNFKIIRTVIRDGKVTEMEFMVDSVGQGKEIAEELKKQDKEAKHKAEYELREKTVTGWTEWADEDGKTLGELIAPKEEENKTISVAKITESTEGKTGKNRADENKTLSGDGKNE